jgi:5-methyltetrahydropteroyltriglutamate--homocysteine methyltransferase
MRPPYRADHVGSLLRPPRLRQARSRREAGTLSAAELRAVEDDCIREAVRWQEALGLQSVTDGEFRRSFYHVDFLARLEGVSTAGKAHRVRYRGKRKRIDYDVPTPMVSGKLRRRSSLAVEEIGFLRAVATRRAKVCIPAPSMLHFRGGRRAVDRAAYPSMEEFFDDLVQVYREELAALYAAGCRYVQLDDPNIAFLCDPRQRGRVRARGENPEALPALYADLIQKSIAERPADLAVTVHLCRGNFSSGGAARGGYEPVADAIFGCIKANGFFLEFDDERSGGFEPLRFVPKGTRIVLGLVSTKRPGLEDKGELMRKIESASKYMPLESLCLSPQCGFSSTHHGTDLTQEEQAAKLRLVVETAAQVWGVH